MHPVGWRGASDVFVDCSFVEDGNCGSTAVKIAATQESGQKMFKTNRGTTHTTPAA